MRVFKDQERWPLPRKRHELFDKRRERHLASPLRILRRRRIAAFRRDPEQLGKKPGAFGGHFAGFGEQRFKLVEAGRRVIIALETGGALDPRYERIEGAVAMLERAKVAEPDVRLIADVLLNLGR